MKSFALSIVHALTDLVCPERCAACSTLVASDSIFCHACGAHVNVLGPPECDACGRPAPTATPCPDCTSHPDPSVRHARAWATYRVGRAHEPVVRALASFKYDHVTRLCRRMAQVMASRVPDPSVDLIVPVPLHDRRLRARGFNQSALLARHVGRALRVPVDFDLLVRTRDTPSQTRSNLRERHARVADAFRVTRRPAGRWGTVLVVDDVWTSGATARATAGALRTAGARAVDVVTFARASHPDAPPRNDVASSEDRD